MPLVGSVICLVFWHHENYDSKIMYNFTHRCMLGKKMIATSKPHNRLNLEPPYLVKEKFR